MQLSGRQVLHHGPHREARSQRCAHIVRAAVVPLVADRDVKHKLKAADRVQLGESDLRVSSECWDVTEIAPYFIVLMDASILN